jgi:hypothetical protein
MRSRTLRPVPLAPAAPLQPGDVAELAAELHAAGLTILVAPFIPDEVSGPLATDDDIRAAEARIATRCSPDNVQPAPVNPGGSEV